MSSFTTKFTVNSKRFDPYLGFKFKVKWDGKYIAGLNKCSALKRTTESTKWFEGGNASTPYVLPAKTTFGEITLETGITYDTTLEDWANKVNNYQGDAATSLATFRKDITIEVYNTQGVKVLAYNVYRCWPSEYQALPQLDAGGSAVMIATLKLENEGWARDTSVTEVAET